MNVKAVNAMLSGLHVEDDGRPEFGDRRMDVNGPAQAIDRGAGIHHVENAVDRFVAARSEDGCAEDLSTVGISDDLHESARVALLDGAADTRHRALAHQDVLAGLARLCLAHADPAERRVDVERITGQARGNLAALAIEKIGGDDLEKIARASGRERG